MDPADAGRVRMFNVSEVTTVKARQTQALALAGFVTALASGSLSTLGAQSRTAPAPDAARIMVATFKSTDKKLGVQAGDEIRERLTRDIGGKQLWVIPKTDVENTLKASGYPTDQALAPNDARELAKLLRADEYMEGTVTKEGGGVKVEPRLVLTRDNSIRQPLPTITTKSVGDAAKQIGKSVEAARKQLDAEKKCVVAWRSNDYAKAVQEARAGIAAYPQSTIARACLMNAMVSAKAPTDSVLKVAQEILAIDPQNRTALQLSAQTYKDMATATQDSAQKAQLQDKAISAWTTLLAADPSNTKVVDQVVREIAGSGQAKVAVPIINNAVQQNPGDPGLTRLQWLILLASQDWKGAIKAGDELVKLDTAAADADYYTKLAAAYTADSQPQKAAEAIAQGTKKFPGNAGLQLVYAQTLRAAGQTQQALEAAKKAVAADPKVEKGYLQIAQIYNELNQPDSVVAALNQAKANGESPELLGQYALSLGNQRFKAASASKKIEDFQAAQAMLTFSDQLSASDQAKFLNGAAAFSIGQISATEAPKTKSCQLAKQAQEAFNVAQINLPRGASFAKEAAAQYMGYLQQFTPVVDKQVKAYCK
jgi:hypothetical protein